MILPISISKLGKDDLDRFIALIRLFEVAFDMKNFELPNTHHLRKLLSRSDFFVFVARLGDTVVGGLTAYTLEQYYAEKPLAYLFDLAVAVEHQRQGIGRKLVAALNGCCAQEGFKEVFVQADLADDYALDFYRSTRPTAEEEVIHFSYSLNR